ncbi:hypothetical protein CN327_30885 [Bacillus cereus]|nr:hypothetical protein CN509_15510 [Bacillus cereus]PET09157.1 hypothetical protein CN505_03305 [Bacillus cereus]PFF26004.1 hypothetical protein CN327_30885 [Bacillus cereus]PFS00099.1 hypothetical protein COK55_31925 [Bacillus cereus]PGW32303.1 hypothetical protein COE04_22245 [Bacillus cereus]
MKVKYTILTVRWYLRYSLNFSDLMEMMEECGLSMAHITIIRWVHQYGPELEERARCHLGCTPILLNLKHKNR